MGTLFRQTPNNGYPFPPKWPLKMGTGLEASAAPVAAPGFKKWGGGQEGGNDWFMGGQTCERSAHSEREARADFFELLGSDFFLGKHVRGAHIASAYARADFFFWGANIYYFYGANMCAERT